MGITTKTVSTYHCDVCRKDIEEDQIFRNDRMVLWADRDVHSVALLKLEIEISYSTPLNICCRGCAVKILRRFADRLEK